ncbi:MAG: hypothetical protein ABIC95_07435 [archaeon]
MMKKGQAAMEFLMTYGWAILVVLAAIGALAYFGILSPEKVLPERCTGPAGLDCVEKASVDSGAKSISFALKNNLGIDINITTVAKGTTDDTDCDVISAAYAVVGGTTYNITTGATAQAEARVDNSDPVVITIECGIGDSEVPEGRVKAEFTVEYESLETGLVQKGGVSIRGRGVN